MFTKKIISGITIASTVFILTSCGANTSPIIEPILPGDGTTNQVPNVSGLKFTKVSDQKIAEYNTLVSQNASRDSAGNASGASTPMVATAGVAKMAGGTAAYPMSYFPYPGAFEEYVVTDFEEAKTGGFNGTYLEALKNVVKPIVKDLGSDARMVNSNGSIDNSGTNNTSGGVDSGSAKPGANPVPSISGFQWQFTYVSSAKKEVYNINISSNETLVLKQQWGIKDLDTDQIKIDSNEAIRLVTKAINDKTFTSPDNQPSYLPPEAELLYDVPQNTNWYLYLEQEKGTLIWNINMNYDYNTGYAYAVRANTTTAVGQPPIATSPDSTSVNPNPPSLPEYYYSGGYARVDAATGKIITLMRPTRYKNNVQVNPPCCKPDAPVPVDAVK